MNNRCLQKDQRVNDGKNWRFKILFQKQINIALLLLSLYSINLPHTLAAKCYLMKSRYKKRIKMMMTTRILATCCVRYNVFTFSCLLSHTLATDSHKNSGLCEVSTAHETNSPRLQSTQWPCFFCNSITFAHYNCRTANYTDKVYNVTSPIFNLQST